MLLSHEQPPECKCGGPETALMAVEISNESAASLIQSVTVSQFPVRCQV